MYDTKLASQAEQDDMTREQRKAERQKEIEERRERHQQAIKDLVRKKLLSESAVRKNLKIELTPDTANFKYRLETHGDGQIYIVTPLRLQPCIEDKSGTAD